MKSTNFDVSFWTVTLATMTAFAIVMLFVLSSLGGLYSRALAADAARTARAAQLEIEESRFFEIAAQSSHSAADEAFMLKHLHNAGVPGY